MRLDEKTLSNLAYIKRASRDINYYSYLITTRRSKLKKIFHESVNSVYGGYQRSKPKPKPKVKSKRALDEILLGNTDENDFVALLKVLAFVTLRLALVFIYMPINFFITLIEKILKK
jgi:hypothetical protein